MGRLAKELYRIECFGVVGGHATDCEWQDRGGWTRTQERASGADGLGERSHNFVTRWLFREHDELIAKKVAEIGALKSRLAELETRCSIPGDPVLVSGGSLKVLRRTVRVDSEYAPDRTSWESPTN